MINPPANIGLSTETNTNIYWFGEYWQIQKGRLIAKFKPKGDTIISADDFINCWIKTVTPCQKSKHPQ